MRGRVAARSLVALLAPACVIYASLAPTAHAQSSTGEDGVAPIHWAYGAFLGTGAYRITDDRSAFLLQIPARWTVSRSGFDAKGGRRIGLELRLPLTLGALVSDSIAGYLDQDTYGTVSITPGLEAEIPVFRDWLLRPYFAVGWGAELGPGDSSAVRQSALIYQVGMKSRYRLPTDMGTWAVLAAVQFAGYNPDSGESSDLLVVAGGIETRQRFFQFFRDQYPLFIEAHATYSYVTDLNRRRERAPVPSGVDDFWEVGLGISQGIVPFRIWHIPIERVGLAFQLSTDRDYRAVKLSFRSPFRK